MRQEALREVLKAKTIIKLCAHVQTDVAFVLAVTKHVAPERHTGLSMILVRLHSVPEVSVESVLNFSYFRHGPES